jgi:adenosylmethionine-8-amino-7-oxononanoate aminotransferase
VVRDILLPAPPLVIKESEVDRIVGLVREGIASVLAERV